MRSLIFGSVPGVGVLRPGRLLHLFGHVRCEYEIVEGPVVRVQDIRRSAFSIPCAHGLMNTIFSPISMTEFMSWVLMMVVMPYSLVMSYIQSVDYVEVTVEPGIGSVARQVAGIHHDGAGDGHPFYHAAAQLGGIEFFGPSEVHTVQAEGHLLPFFPPCSGR